MILAMMLLVLATPSKAPVVVSSLTATGLAEQCRGKDNDAAANFCTGYILGEFDTLSLSRQICPSPRRASNIEVVTVTRKYLRKNAGNKDVAPSFLVRDALRAAFPCKRR
jgi:hypothetical protein